MSNAALPIRAHPSLLASLAGQSFHTRSTWKPNSRPIVTSLTDCVYLTPSQRARATGPPGVVSTTMNARHAWEAVIRTAPIHCLPSHIPTARKARGWLNVDSIDGRFTLPLKKLNITKPVTVTLSSSSSSSSAHQRPAPVQVYCTPSSLLSSPAS